MESDDLFERRFADQQPASFDEKISIIEQKKWVAHTFEDEILKDVTALTTTADNTVKEMPKIESLENVHVKQRIAKCWPKANKEVIKKSKWKMQATAMPDINPYFCSCYIYTFARPPFHSNEQLSRYGVL